MTTKYTGSILVVLREPVPPFNEVEVKKTTGGGLIMQTVFIFGGAMV